MKRRIVLIIVALFVVSLWEYDRYVQRRRILYEAFGQKISMGLSQAASQGEAEWSIDNQPHVDVVLICEGYTVTQEDLSATKLVSSRLAKQMADNDTDNDGIYLQLAEEDRVRAFIYLPIQLIYGKRFLLARPSDRITFRFQKKKKGSQLVEIH